MRALTPECSGLLKQWEGCKLIGYLDTNGTPTAGYGHTGADAHVGEVYTQQQADLWFDQDTGWAIETVESSVTVALTDTAFGALVSFCYNVGRPSFTGSTLLKKLNAGDYTAVPGELAKWNKETINGKLTVSRGLTNRRAAEAGLWAKGTYIRSAVANPEPPPTPPPYWLRPDVIAAAASGAGTVGTAAVAAADKLHPFAIESNVLKYAFLALMALGVAAMFVANILQHKKDNE